MPCFAGNLAILGVRRGWRRSSETEAERFDGHVEPPVPGARMQVGDRSSRPAADEGSPIVGPVPQNSSVVVSENVRGVRNRYWVGTPLSVSTLVMIRSPSSWKTLSTFTWSR